MTVRESSRNQTQYHAFYRLIILKIFLYIGQYFVSVKGLKYTGKLYIYLIPRPMLKSTKS